MLLNMLNRLIYKVNVKSDFQDLKVDIINDALKTRHKQNFNFEVFTDYKQKLYDTFINHSENLLNDFTLKDKDFKLWCYFTDHSFNEGDTWHNHINTATINGVLYLKTVKNKGIEFENEGEKFYFEPQDFDLVIFPDFLNHRPVTSKVERRVSLNMELRCNESSEDIFRL